MKKLLALLCCALIAVSSASAQSNSSIEKCPPAASSAAPEGPASELSDIAVHFEVPDFIEIGLKDGTLERVGGVIRYSQDQQILAWLRQGGQVGQLAESSASLLQRLIPEGVGMAQLITGALPFLNIGMAGYSIVEHIAGIRVHEAELERIYDRVSEEFQRDREVEMLAALNSAENAFLAKCDEYKLATVAQVNYELENARAQLTRDLDELLKAPVNKENIANIELASMYQILAMKVCAMSTRLSLDIGEEAIALNTLKKCVKEHTDFAEQFARKWIGRRTAHYFHESVSDEHFASFLRIEGWLQGERDVLAELLQKNRKYFWQGEALDPLIGPGIGRPIDEDPLYKTALPFAELLIENVQRLTGYELELNSLLVPFSQWDAYERTRIDRHIGYVMLLRADAARA